MSANKHPVLLISRDDHEELIDLALRGLGKAPGATLLLQEMQRARVVDAEALPPHVLAMNDRVEFELDGSTYRDFQLVYPQCANFSEGRISVLTPVGAALIGLAEHDTFAWPDGQRGEHRLKINKVRRAS
jgi:regulator of nucleoside diphosphate kinase